jgi:hypothetical protein
MVGQRRDSATEEERGQLVVEPLPWGTVDLMISDLPGTPYHRADPPSPTLDTANPNSNRLGSGSSPRISPLGNRIICRVIQLPTSTWTQPAIGHPGTIIDAHPLDSTVQRV